MPQAHRTDKPADKPKAEPKTETTFVGRTWEATSSAVEHAVEVVKEAVGPPGCPHCDGPLKAHADGLRQHCNGCGCCFIDGELRPGHPGCTPAA